MNLAVWLDHARAGAIDGDTLIIEFDEGQVTGHDSLNRPENRSVLESALASITSNLSTFRTVFVALARSGNQNQDPAPADEGTLSEEALLTAMSDPGVAKLVDVFRGKIVQIQDTAGPADSDTKPEA